MPDLTLLPEVHLPGSLSSRLRADEEIQTLPPPCPCDPRSHWDFLGDFYRRVDDANRRTMYLEQCLSQANAATRDAVLVRDQYANDLANSRLEIRATIEELKIERGRAEEAEKYLQYAFEEARKTSYLIDRLKGDMAMLKLQMSSPSRQPQAIPAASSTNGDPSLQKLLVDAARNRQDAEMEADKMRTQLLTLRDTTKSEPASVDDDF